MATLKLEIVTPEAKVYSEDVDMVTLPGVEGEMGIYPQHVPLMTQLIAGEVSVRKGNQNFFLAVGDGFVEVTGERVSILTDMAIQADNIDEAKAEEARKAEEIRKATEGHGPVGPITEVGVGGGGGDCRTGAAGARPRSRRGGDRLAHRGGGSRVEPQHPARARGRERLPQAAERVHVLPQGRQGRQGVARCRAPS